MIGGDVQSGVVAQGGGGYGPPPGGYGMPPGGAPPGGMPPGGMPPGGMPPGGPGMPPGGYGAPMAPPGGGPMPGGPPGAGGGNEELKKQAKTWMIISFVSMFCCTSCFGLIGGIFCYMASSAIDQGNIADAESKLKWGKIITIIGFVLGVLSYIGYSAYYALVLSSL